MISIYDYMDFRSFLKDRFSEIKRDRPSFSYRVFNRLAKISSSAFLKLVIDGKRNLGAEGIQKISIGFNLSEAEKGYFESLVKFNQATTHEEKDLHYNELCRNKKFLTAKPLASFQYRLFKHWYHVAILEAVRIVTPEPKNLPWLQRVVHPPISTKQIKKAVKELKSLQLMDETKEGGFYRLDNMVATEDEVRSLAVANFHVQMCQSAARSVIHEDAKEREFSTLTVLSSEKSFNKAKREIQKFRKKLHSILEQENDGPKTFVAHINLQLFKLTKDAGKL